MSPASSSPLVSVVLPTYNRASLITRAIESVLGQEFTDLELIVIDDGSTDETSQVISRINDERLRFVHFEQNRGETFARNQGLQRARGELIAQMDSDDLWYPQKTSYQIELFERYRQLDLIFCNMLEINHLTDQTRNYFKKVARAFQRLQVQELGGDAWEIRGGLPEALLISTIIPHPTVMFRRSMLESVGRYNETLRGGGDFEYWWRAAVKEAKFAYTSRALVECHIHGKNLTSDMLAMNVRHLQALEICEQTARDLGRNDMLPLFTDARYVSWHGIMLEQARRGNRREAFAAYKESIKVVRRPYGLSVVLLSYLLSVGLGPWSVERTRKWIGPGLLERIRKLRQPGG